MRDTESVQESTVRRTLAMLATGHRGRGDLFLAVRAARSFLANLFGSVGLTNLQLGIVYSVYGVIAMVGLFLGGPLADRVAPRILMSIALLATSAGGLLLISIPTFSRTPVALWLLGCDHDSAVLGTSNSRDSAVGRSRDSRTSILGCWMEAGDSSQRASAPFRWHYSPG